MIFAGLLVWNVHPLVESFIQENGFSNGLFKPPIRVGAANLMSSTSNRGSVCVRTTSHVGSIDADQISYYIIVFHETFVFNHFQWCLPRNGSSSTWTVSMRWWIFEGSILQPPICVERFLCQGLMWLLLRYPFVIRRQFALPLPFVTELEPGVLVGEGCHLGILKNPESACTKLWFFGISTKSCQGCCILCPSLIYLMIHDDSQVLILRQKIAKALP